MSATKATAKWAAKASAEELAKEAARLRALAPSIANSFQRFSALACAEICEKEMPRRQSQAEFMAKWRSEKADRLNLRQLLRAESVSSPGCDPFA